MSEWILSSCLLIVIVIGLRFLLRGRIQARLQYALWALVLVRLLLPVFLGSSRMSLANYTDGLKEQAPVKAILEIGELSLPTRSYEDAYREVVAEYEARGTRVESLQGSELEALEYEAMALTRGPSLSRILKRCAAIVWYAGMALTGALFLFTDLRFARRLKRSRQPLHADGQGLPVYISEEIDTPCLFGLLHPGIYVTRETTENPTLLRHAVAHERTHFRHGDHCWAILRGVCLIIHWYNPLVWLAAFLSRRDGELACDEATIRTLGESQRAEYGRTLLRITCHRKDSLLLISTTMTGDSRGIRERIQRIARQPKAAAYTIPIVLLVALAAVGCTFTGARNIPETELPGEDPSKTLPMETLAEEALPREVEPVETEPAYFHREASEEQVCLAVLPTAISTAGDDYRYLIPEDSERIQKLYLAATATAQPCNFRDATPGQAGWWIVSQGQWWQVMADGTLYCFDPGTSVLLRVDPKDAAELYEACTRTVREAGLTAPVQPEELTGIRSATLQWNGTHTLTDAYSLSRLESMLVNSREESSVSCWFTASLTLELESGETRTILMATDSCAVWMSEGVAYHYGEVTEEGISGNEEFYSFFAPELIHRVFREDISSLPEWMEYINWRLYAQAYDSDEVLALMDWVEDWVKEAPSDGRLSAALRWLSGMDGAYTERYAAMLTRFYELAPKEFAQACQSMPRLSFEQIRSFLSVEWDMTPEQVEARLQSDLPTP